MYLARISLRFLFIVFLSQSVLLAGQPPLKFPTTPKRLVVDEYHGVKVTDDYRWLEDAHDPAVQKWIAEQNRFTGSFLDANPIRARIAARLKNLYASRSAVYYNFYNRGRFFAIKRDPSKNQPILVQMTSPEDPDSERAVLDPNELDPSGRTTIDFYSPSFDGRYVAVSLSENGSENGNLYIYETATGSRLADVIERVQYPTAGGSVEWNADGTGVYYTRYPKEGERRKEDIDFYQQIFFHTVGTPVERDTYVIGNEFPRIAEVKLTSSEDARYLLATVANGDGGEFEHFLRRPDGKWTQLTQFADLVKSISFGDDGKLYLLSVKDAPRGKILTASLKDTGFSRIDLLIPQRRSTIENFIVTSKRLYVGEMYGGPSVIRVFDLNGKSLGRIPTKPISSVQVGIRLKGDDIVFGSQSYTEPYTWYRYDPSSRAVTRMPLSGASNVDFSDLIVERAFATSKDGTKVPMNIVRSRKARLDGKNPTILYGYGGYSVSLAPAFQRRNRLWFDAGGIYVEANLRGGGEFGEDWHQAGKLTRKQNVFDDFAACARYLIASKYTSPTNLTIEGGSNGGLLIGAALTQHPELFRAAVGYAGWYDMLRLEAAPNGVFNVPELGTVRDLEQFKSLYAYSPYHRVKDGLKYPGVLFITGDNDRRVDPMHSRKMTARLQTATASGLPVLLRTYSDAGHGAGSAIDARIAQETDLFTFLFEQLKIAPPNHP